MRLGFLLLAALVLAALHGMCFWWSPPGSTRVERAELLPPFRSEIGHCRQADLATDAESDAAGGGRSTLALFEDAVPLGPAHAMHDEIRQTGRGRFSHWGQVLYFSTSDNSDPNGNGRRYTIEVTRTVALWPHLLLVVVDLLLIVVLVLFATRRQGRWLRVPLRSIVVVAATVAALEGASRIVFRARLADQGETVQALVAASLDGGSDRSFHGESVIYAEHPYLNYVLNPDFHGGVARQFERSHRIRRSEPLRARNEVSLRILALGGSTTYGEQLDAESDTWVHRLEQRLRARLGPGVDVVNGGVGGYTLLENTIHYVTLLSSLQPDIVLLYEGINDVHPRLFGTLARDYSNYRVPWRSDGWVLPVPVSWLRALGVYRLYYLQRHVLPLQRAGIGGLASRDYPDAAGWAASLERNGTEVFEEHLRDLVRLVLAQGRRAVLLPQHFQVTNARDAVFVHGVQQHNEVDRRVAAELGVPFLAGLVAEGAFARTDTFDNCHFNAAGSEKMAGYVDEFLQQQGLLR